MPQIADKLKGHSAPGSAQGLYDFLPDGSGFISRRAFGLRSIYFPLCGVDADSIRSSITPCLSGDIKMDRDHYLTKPASVEDLRQDVRNFFCYIKDKQVVSFTSGDGSDAVVEAGMLWHKIRRAHPSAGIEMEAVNFIPVSDGSVELMRITVRNSSDASCTLTPTFSLPIFGRALTNKHDHEHVTSLLHRIEQLPDGVCVEPTMSFNERGHRINEAVYYVLGMDAKGRKPAGTFPTAESFYGESGNMAAPEAVVNNAPPPVLPKEAVNGKEAMGALRFADETLAPGESREYLIIMGVSSSRAEMARAFSQFNSSGKFEAALEKNRSFWEEKSRTIEFSKGDKDFNAWMRWVGLQPVLRRIFGCSFLPDHDYGRGGKGWRDIWQDLLSLTMIEPEHIRKVLVDNFAGVRIDGSNATIIGAAAGEFVADRNAIARVWMDHGAWPFLTLLLYIDQTGDYSVLLEDNTYFRDAQQSRTLAKDYSWTEIEGSMLTDRNKNVYRGSVLEHVLVEHLTQFFNVGEHNNIRLEGADWNDGLDMARERGESVAFTSLYGGNLLALADLLEDLSSAKGIKEISLSAEVTGLLDSLTGTSIDYGDPQAKKKFLFETYFPSVQPVVSGKKVSVPVKKIAGDLRKKGNWIFDHIRANEMVSVDHEGSKANWFNGYYDNKSMRLEGVKEDVVRMTLTGQVFPIMSGLANDEEIKNVLKSVTTYLRDERSGGLRLNTDFHVPHYSDMGRAFAFAYGAKENGAVFNHMSVMYACALYKRGFVREGYDVISSIQDMCLDTDRSKVYPGIPEYFDLEGRGRYHYLTGAASWLVLTQLTEVFGVRGKRGDLLIAPKLVKEEFDPKTGIAMVASRFAGKKITVTYENTEHLDYGSYKIEGAYLNGEAVALSEDNAGSVTIKRELIEQTLLDCTIRIVLSDI